jgi:hypothetical protein
MLRRPQVLDFKRSHSGNLQYKNRTPTRRDAVPGFKNRLPEYTRDGDWKYQSFLDLRELGFRCKDPNVLIQRLYYIKNDENTALLVHFNSRENALQFFRENEIFYRYLYANSFDFEKEYLLKVTFFFLRNSYIPDDDLTYIAKMMNTVMREVRQDLAKCQR